MKRNDVEIEICANSVASCLAAQEGGADRVELCMGIPEGGTTPSYGEIKMAREKLTTTRLHVIIRNRGGDFVYTPDELQRMAIDIDICRQLGVDGVVFGCLTPEGDVDKEANRFLLSHAKGLSVTFHRAFDRCCSPREALEEICDLGFQRVLTSGQQPTAEQGIALLSQLHAWAKGRIIVMAGCGVNEQNIAKIRRETQVMAFHFSAREPQPARAKLLNAAVSMGAAGAQEDCIMQTTARRVGHTIAALLADGE